MNMEKNDYSRPSPDSDAHAASEPEGVFAEDEEVAEAIEEASPPRRKTPLNASDSVQNDIEGSSEGIEQDRSRFEEGSAQDVLGFAPSDDGFLIERDSADHSLAFDELSAEAVEVEDGPKKVYKKIVRREKGGLIKGFSAILIYLIFIISAGILSATVIISVANDVFAFTKDDSVYELTITNTDMSLEELADYLHEEGIIRYPFVFRLYVGLKNDGILELHEGTFSISPSYNYDKIMTCLDPPPVREEITITFSEGLTIDDIIDIFVKNGIGTRAGFVEAIQTHKFDYWFLENLQTTDERFYRLEGYLYPDTYRFYSDSTEVAALTKMLNNFEKKVPNTYKTRCEELGLTLDEAVILASLIESECARINDLEYVSAVFHNRMNSSSFNGRLDSDATIQYYLRHTTGERKPELTADDLAIDSPYNSRVYNGLPPGAICNPSLNALMAAVYPAEDCNYYYFVAQANGYNLYAKTLSEHNKNIEQVRKENEANN